MIDLMYDICKPYLEHYEYTETIEIFEQLREIK